MGSNEDSDMTSVVVIIAVVVIVLLVLVVFLACYYKMKLRKQEHADDEAEPKRCDS